MRAERHSKKLISEEDIEKLREVLRQEESLPIEKSQQFVSDFVEAFNNLDGIRQEWLRQAKTAFNVELLMTIVAVLIIFFGVILLFLTGSVTVSVITGISGIIIKVISKLFFPISKEANDRLDRLDKTRSAMRVIAEISDPAKRDKAIDDLAVSLRGLMRCGL